MHRVERKKDNHRWEREEWKIRKKERKKERMKDSRKERNLERENAQIRKKER